jgi:hypothetical protein
MKAIVVMILALTMTGCAFNIAWRGTLTYVEQSATKLGTVASTPTQGNTSIAAEKTTDAKLDIPLK